MWSCAINNIVFMRNRTFSRAVEPANGVPLTLLTGAIHDASALRVFGCAPFVKIPDNQCKRMYP
jgi:hypothetical protein